MCLRFFFVFCFCCCLFWVNLTLTADWSECDQRLLSEQPIGDCARCGPVPVIAEEEVCVSVHSCPSPPHRGVVLD